MITKGPLGEIGYDSDDDDLNSSTVDSDVDAASDSSVGVASVDSMTSASDSSVGVASVDSMTSASETLV